MSRVDRFEFTLDEDTEKRLHELLTDMDTRNTNRFWITDKRGYRAEYVKVRHGKFIGTEYDGYADGYPVYYEWKCSECGCVFEEEEPTYKYCPNCGARMDEEREEE